MKTIDKLRKFAEGGKVKKYGLGDIIEAAGSEDVFGIPILNADEKTNYDKWLTADSNVDTKRQNLRNIKLSDYNGDIEQYRSDREKARNELNLAKAQRTTASHQEGVGKGKMAATGQALSTPEAKAGLAAASEGFKLLDETFVGDKNFGAQSEAIDGAVHAASSALMQSGNPYAMVAGAALEGANFLTKAGGQTVQGFDVDINSSGYGDLGHMESSSSRDFGAMIGLGGLNQGKMQAKLAKRNQQAMMAMNAANIANEQSFEQEARMNSVQNTIMNNQIALAGGLDTSLLGG